MYRAVKMSIGLEIHSQLNQLRQRMQGATFQRAGLDVCSALRELPSASPLPHSRVPRDYPAQPALPSKSSSKDQCTTGVSQPRGFPPNDAFLPRGSGPEVSAMNAQILGGAPEVFAKNFGGDV